MTVGCLDFEKFRVPLGGLDSGAALDATVTPDRLVVADVRADGADGGVSDQPVGCDPGPETRVRLAHMASGFGAVKLCMRRNSLESPFAPVGDVFWPAGGLAYMDVSPHVVTNERITQGNESWQFAVVPVGAECGALGLTTAPVASVTVRLNPREHATLLFTSQPTLEGSVVGALGVFTDRVCPECPAGSVDVRAVHASMGAAIDRLSFAISYTTPPDFSVPAVNVFFANNVPYGGAAFTGEDGFDCDTAWWSAALLPDDYTVHFSVRALGGGEVARSAPYALQSESLRRSRVATLFFAGDPPGAGATSATSQRFVLCYEGNPQEGALGCVAIPLATPTPDAGPGVDAAPDASMTPDAAPGPDGPLPLDAGVPSDEPLPDADDLPDAEYPQDGGHPRDAEYPQDAE